MNSNKSLKVVMCADFLGTGAVDGSTIGSQKIINEWISHSANDPNIELVVYCLGTKKQQYYPFNNVSVKQYKPYLSNRALLPLVPPSVFPFLVDLIPIHPNLIIKIIQEKPDIIHTFDTFGVTDIAGYIAAKIMQSQKKPVKLINTVMGEVDTYFADYLKRIVIYFYKIVDTKSILRIIYESAKGGVYATSTQHPSLISLLTFILKFFTYWQSGSSAILLLKLFELLGIIQDSIVKAVQALLKFIFKAKYQQLEVKINHYVRNLREFSLTGRNRKKSRHWFNYLTKPLQLTYDFVRRGDEKGPKVGLSKLLANILRFSLKSQISYYVNRCDAVTVSRPEDIARYYINTPVWELPLGCDLSQFKVYEPSVDTFSERVQIARQLEMLSNEGANALIDFATNPEKISKRCIIYVGRLSDEKNISILIDVYEHLLQCKGIKDKVHFIFIGAGFAASEIKNRFGDSVTVTGLVPNHLLPDIYNFVRLRHGFFVSASDTETYGITHEEAAACGVPLVAMEKGTRGHFYRPGDRIGSFKIETDEEITRTIEDLIVHASSNFIVTLNGLCIPDYSDSKGLSTLSTNHTVIESVQKSLLCAMYCMAVLPESTSAKMSKYASELTQLSKFGSDGTWKLLHYIYLNDWKSFYTFYNQKQHVYF
ncbi:sucrose-phosphate synthase [Calothrix sp. NIES-4071]|nr:sucrose-phosphate synthase [Calothrix sp. NIES-4071]BAZ58582.1 sucrose-phosphate synthase [Calothrix sp. NIES-4105]